MRKIVYTCPYVPVEWVRAHGLEVMRLMPKCSGREGDVSEREGMCPFAAAFAEEAIKHKEEWAIVVTTGCDQMRRVFDLIYAEFGSACFLMNVPSTWEQRSAKKLYEDELKRLGRFLVGLGGEAVSNEKLSGVMEEYNKKRKELRNSRGRLNSRAYSEMIAGFYCNGEIEFTKSSSRGDDGIALAVTGGPMVAKDFELFDIIEKAGGHVELDATETGERGMCGMFDVDRSRDDALGELVRAYFDEIVEVWQRPNVRLYEWLKRKLVERKVRGLIVRRYVWCDMWHGEVHRLKEELDIPVIDIDVSGQAGAYERAKSRIEAFVEMLS
jgi:benzoyl-CoA reductase/2-hydroxyglutaryl-CoA dehydratase subunit BcrC/BadD/HgdB